MNQTITVSSKTIQEILSRLDQLTKEVRSINSKLFESEPAYGSDEWWEWSNAKALKEIQEGKGTLIHNKKELKEFFQSLKAA